MFTSGCLRRTPPRGADSSVSTRPPTTPSSTTRTPSTAAAAATARPPLPEGHDGERIRLQGRVLHQWNGADWQQGDLPVPLAVDEPKGLEEPE
ncbi:uncharacterized protein J3R85_004738 [Psidium guajava]|nr:uncharacterized protein J3R85_004738 [Psidium guajava]